MITVKEHSGLTFYSRSFSCFALMPAYNRNIQVLHVRPGGQRHIDLKSLDRKPALCLLKGRKSAPEFTVLRSPAGMVQNATKVEIYINLIHRMTFARVLPSGEF